MNQQELLEQILPLPSNQENQGEFVEIDLNDDSAGCSGICDAGSCRS